MEYVIKASRTKGTHTGNNQKRPEIITGHTTLQNNVLFILQKVLELEGTRRTSSQQKFSQEDHHFL
jgi:hypothetical protein